MGIGVSAIVGLTIPVTMTGYSMSTNFGIRLDTPVSFNLGGMEANAGAEFYSSGFSSSIGDKFKITNIIGNVSVFPKESVEIRAGLGLTKISISGYSAFPLSIPLDFNYHLPKSIAGFKFAVNLHAQRTFGYPPVKGIDEGTSTDFIYFGMLINTPLAF